ncbi:MAG: hypothetical protein OXL36_18925 [Bryobacterales bacterium]|nr:hypothetical protein [Bryobacterales bacterium]MDE0296521.1 hypothetical protein [Bryobacterales bacterium]
MSPGVRSLAHLHLHRNPAEAVRILERCPSAGVAELLAGGAYETSARVLALLSPVVASDCIERMPVMARCLVLQASPVPVAAALLRVLPESSRKTTLEGLPAQTRKRIDRVLRFPKESAGALADPRALVLHEENTVDQAVSLLRADGETISATLFVINRGKRVLGAVTPAQLLAAPGDWTIGSLKLAKPRTVSQGVPLLVLVSDEHYQGGPVAVLDPSGKLVGVLTEDTLRTVEKPKAPQRATHLLASIGEMYWCGMGRLLGDVIAVRRTSEATREANRA